jgi:hypothetical protein
VKLGLSLREEQRLRMCENKPLRGIIEPRGEEVTGKLTEVCNRGLHKLFLVLIE